MEPRVQKIVAACVVLAGVVGILVVMNRKGGDDEISDLPPIEPPAAPGKEEGSVGAEGKDDTPKASNVKGKVEEDEEKEKKKKSDGGEKRKEKGRLTKILEESDKEGKKLFKEGKYLEAADAFGKAIEASRQISGLEKQLVILLNNRSAMYEKAGMVDLALDDCASVLELEVAHEKARKKRARIFEGLTLFNNALTELCAIQLDFMHKNKASLMRGIPLNPPVEQKKMEDLCEQCLPAATSEAEEMRAEWQKKRVKDGKNYALPAKHTVGMLMESFSSCSVWRSEAEADLDLGALAMELARDVGGAERADLLFRRGRRNAFERKYDDAFADFRLAEELAEKEGAQGEMKFYPQLLEWLGVCKHLSYDLTGAIVAYEKCIEVTDKNDGDKHAELRVKCAGIKMDAGEIEVADSWFAKALEINADFPDALLHRSNLYMLKRDLENAKKDIEKCLKVKPDFLAAQLRQATLCMHLDQPDKALKCLELADSLCPKNSDVQVYRGELFFTMGKVDEALKCFEKGMEYDSSNPNAYVNAALAIMNIPPVMGHPPDTGRACDLLEKGLEIDPQFQGAYIHLGQLKLTLAKDIDECLPVIKLYKEGLCQCRTKDEMSDLLKMLIMAECQYDAAKLLGMTTMG